MDQIIWANVVSANGLENKCYLDSLIWTTSEAMLSFHWQIKRDELQLSITKTQRFALLWRGMPRRSSSLYMVDLPMPEMETTSEIGLPPA